MLRLDCKFGIMLKKKKKSLSIVIRFPWILSNSSSLTHFSL